MWASFPDVLNLILAVFNFANGHRLAKYTKLNPPRNIHVRRIRYIHVVSNIHVCYWLLRLLLSACLDTYSDFGFERVNLNSPCTPMPGIVWPPAPPTGCPENGTYNFTSGLVTFMMKFW